MWSSINSMCLDSVDFDLPDESDIRQISIQKIVGFAFKGKLQLNCLHRDQYIGY